jgi:outer membrane protein TolC
MARHHWSWGLLLGLTVPLVSCRSVTPAEPFPVQEGPSPSAPAASAMTLNLAECLSLALERQPRLTAARASMAAAEDGKRGLEALRFPATLDPEIPVRRKQAALGVTAAAAGLDQAEREVVYAVTRIYFTILYAREQERLARGVVERLSATREAAEQALNAGARDVTSADVDRALVYLHLAEAKQTQATQGVKRALAALNEAVGLDPDISLDVPPGRLPVPEVRPGRDDVGRAALGRRGDLVQANIFAQVACLEVEAQRTGTHQRMQTFAAGSDLHARQVPQGVHNAEYRPGAVPPEMPTLLAGSRSERVKHAQSLSARAEAMIEATRNLIALEAADAFLRWEEASQQARQARKAADAGDKLANDLSKDFAAGLKVKVEEVVSARVLAAEARSQYNEFIYRQVLALADLERVTAGGFCAGLVEPAAPMTRQVPAQNTGAR